MDNKRRPPPPPPKEALRKLPPIKLPHEEDKEILAPPIPSDVDVHDLLTQLKILANFTYNDRLSTSDGSLKIEHWHPLIGLSRWFNNETRKENITKVNELFTVSIRISKHSFYKARFEKEIRDAAKCLDLLLLVYKGDVNTISRIKVIKDSVREMEESSSSSPPTPTNTERRTTLQEEF
jgi:hypothetical protein